MTAARCADLALGGPPRLGAVRLVAVDGGSGAGKSVFAAALAAAVRAAGARCAVVPCDAFATWDNPAAWWPQLEAGVLGPLAAGRPGRYRATTWVGGVPRPGDWVDVPVPDVLVVEGVTSARRAVAARLTLAVWVDGGTAAQRLEAAVARDGEGSRADLRRWQLFEAGWFTVDGTEGRCVRVAGSGREGRRYSGEMAQMIRWQVPSPGPMATHPLERVQAPVPEPGPGELLVRVLACGVCRTDLHVAEGDLPVHKVSVVPGHEVVGEVVAIGERAHGFAVGERVGVAWLRHTCGSCDYCLRGSENLCPLSRYTGWDADGGYAEYTTVPADYALRLPEQYTDTELAPLLCAGIIGYRALTRAELPEGGRLGVYGFGASAHLAAQVALARGATVHVMTRSAAARRLALDLGATSAQGAADAPPEPLDSAILFAPAGELVLPAMEALAPGGTLAIAGIHLSDIPTLNYSRHLFQERQLRSVTANTRVDAREFLDFAGRHHLKVATTPYPLEQADQALADLAADKVTGAAVLVPGAAARTPAADAVDADAVDAATAAAEAAAQPAQGPYRQAFERSTSDPEGFWLQAAQAIDWDTPPEQALDAANPPFYRWFPGARMNTCFNALDRHVRDGRGEQAALVYDSAMLQTQQVYTYAQLLNAVARFAGALRSKGVGKGDRVVVYLPMIPEAAVAMLACARIGAVHSVVFGGFAAKELAARIDDAQPKVLVTATGGLEPGRAVEYLPLVEQALSLAAHTPSAVVVKRREQVPGELRPGWLDWDELAALAEPAAPVPVAATDPLYVLYTSGTTGKPKGVERDNGGHAVALAWSMRNIYDVGPGQVMWAASDVGWVVGHSYIVYAPLLVGATTVLYEGKPVGTPDAGAFWRVVRDHKVRALFTAPTALRAIRKVDPAAAELAKYDTSSLVTLFAAGERLDPDTYQWATDTLGVPVVDHWWQTETGWPICANPRGLEPMALKAGSPSVPVPGYQVQVLDGGGAPVPAGVEGNIVVRLPLPPGTLAGLWGDPDRYVRSYLSTFEGCYLTGDSGYLDEDGYLFVLGRSDDVINVAGHRLSTGGIEASIAGHPAVAECAVVGVVDELKGQRPSAYVVLKAGVSIPDEVLAAELVAKVREDIGAVASFRDVTVVPALPKTRSGKILRKTIRSIADGADYAVPSTIEDPAVLSALERQLRG